METLIQKHGILLRDKVRMNAYAEAIKKAVKRDDIVIDIGCGSGILSFLALKAGAKHVHAIEVEPNTLELARHLAKRNGLEKKITFHKGLSTNIKSLPKADLVISELFGSIGLNENLLAVVIDAKKRFLKPEGRLLPECIKCFVAPCENKWWANFSKELGNVCGFNLFDLEDVDMGTPVVDIAESELLAAPVEFCSIDLYKVSKPFAFANVKFKIERAGVLNSFAAWFETDLFGGVTFDTAPSSPSTHWKQCLLPLAQPEKVQAQTRLNFSIEISPDRSGLNSSIGYGYELRNT